MPLPVPFSIHEAGAEEDVGRESAAAGACVHVCMCLKLTAAQSSEGI